MDYALILLDDPRPKVRRITLNRPDQRNPLSNALRTELFDALEAADRDEGVAVIVIRGAGSSFCAGYDLKTNVAEGQRQRRQQRLHPKPRDQPSSHRDRPS